jgi:hypothetical protein
VHCESRVTAAIVPSISGTQKGERPPLEAGTGGLVRDSRPSGLCACIMNCRV